MTLLWNWSLLLCILWTIDCSCPFLFLPSLQQQQQLLACLPYLQYSSRFPYENWISSGELCVLLSLYVFSPLFLLLCIAWSVRNHNTLLKFQGCFNNVFRWIPTIYQSFCILIKDNILSNPKITESLHKFFSA